MLSRIKKIITRKEIIPIKTTVYDGNILNGKVALIIGGSGGIGSGFAERFISNGCKVIIAGTNVGKLKDICTRLGENSRWLAIDTRVIESLRDKIESAATLFGTIDILVYSAGVHCHDKFGEIKEETWNDVIDINLKGMYFTCQAIANFMIKYNIKGHILTVSSASSTKPGWTPYEISKWGVRGLTLGFADKLIPHGIVVNSIAPGPVATAMLGRENDNNLAWPGNPTGRMATIEEISNLAVLMVSDMGDLIVGDTFFISGGSGTICIDK